MKNMTLEQIEHLQEAYGVNGTQNSILDGSVWKFEGAAGRFAMRALESGICFLGENTTYDYYGSAIPPRTVLKEGTKGTLGNASKFWTRVQEGDYDAIDTLQDMFGSDEDDSEVLEDELENAE